MKASDFYRMLPTYYGRVQDGKLIIEDPQIVATETKEFFEKLKERMNEPKGYWKRL